MKELDSVLKSIKKKDFLPVYFFHGEEPYFMDVAVKSFENDVLEEDEKAFGQTVIYGKDSNIPEILSLAQQFPMFGDLNLIIVKEAQDLKFNDAERAALEHYLANPVQTTVLVFAHKHKKLLGTTKMAKQLQAKGMLFHSEPVRDYNLAKWIADECTRRGIRTAAAIPGLLAEYLGADLSRIANELTKLQIILKDGQILDEKLVETHIGISKDYNVFELQKALGTKNDGRAMKIAHFMGKNMKNNPMPMVIGSLYGLFSNIIMFQTFNGESQQQIASAMGVSPFFLKDFPPYVRNYPLKLATRVISILREIDLKSKGLGANQTDDAELLTELVYKILNVDKLKVKL